jgi:hypothetical protein
MSILGCVLRVPESSDSGKPSIGDSILIPGEADQEARRVRRDENQNDFSCQAYITTHGYIQEVAGRGVSHSREGDVLIAYRPDHRIIAYKKARWVALADLPLNGRLWLNWPKVQR